MDADVDTYIQRSQQWHDEIAALRPVLLDAGLTEAIKWRKPCYAHGGANICIVQEMKPHLALLFFKGSLLDDPNGVLRDQGPNSRAAKRVEFTSVADVERLTPAVRALVAAAIAVEDAGLSVEPAPEPELVVELRERLADDDALRTAFDALTPGRRREYHLHIAGAKKTETRAARVDRVTPRILAGKGLRDR